MTSLGDGTSAPKDSARVDAYGTIDEMDCFAGMAGVEIAVGVPAGEERELLLRCIAVVQEAAWLLGASLAAPGRPVPGDPDVVVREVENLTARLELAAGPVNGFVVPGSSRAEAALHVARAVCRRAERRVVEVLQPYGQNGPAPWECIVLNRISGLLFAAARATLKAQGVSVPCRGRC